MLRRSLMLFGKMVVLLLFLLVLVYATLPAWFPLGLQAWAQQRGLGTLLLEPEYPNSHQWFTRLNWRYGQNHLKASVSLNYDWHSLKQGRLLQVNLRDVKLTLAAMPQITNLKTVTPAKLETFWQALGQPVFDSMDVLNAQIVMATTSTAQSAPPAPAPTVVQNSKVVANAPKVVELNLHWQRQLDTSQLGISLCADCQSQKPEQLLVLSGRWQGMDGSLEWQAPGANMKLSRSNNRKNWQLQANLAADSPLAMGLVQSAKLDLVVQQQAALTDWMSVLTALRAQGQFNADMNWLGQKLKLALALTSPQESPWALSGSLRGQGQGFDLPQAELQLGVRFEHGLPALSVRLAGSALYWQGHLWQLTGQHFIFDLPWQLWPKTGDWYALLSGKFKGQLAGWQFQPVDLRGEVSVHNSRQLRLEFGLGMKPAEFGQLYVRHDWSTGDGIMNIAMNWPHLEQSALPAPASLLANWPESLQLERGLLSLQSQWRWSEQFSSAPQLELSAKELQGRWQNVPFQLAQLTYQYNPSLPIPSRSLWQLQRGRIGQNQILDPVDGQLYWPWWQDRWALYPLQLQAGFANGQLIAKNTNLQGDGHHFDIEAKNLALAELLALSAQPALIGNGLLSGDLVLAWTDLSWRLTRGRLTSADSGRLFWQGDKTQWLTRGSQYLNLLRDFRYRELSASWDKYAELLPIAITVNGVNPAYYKGQNMSLDLGISVPVKSIIQKLR